MRTGEIIEVICGRSSSLNNLPNFVRLNNYEMLDQQEKNAKTHFF